jgi:hypothetical protein
MDQKSGKMNYDTYMKTIEGLSSIVFQKDQGRKIIISQITEFIIKIGIFSSGTVYWRNLLGYTIEEIIDSKFEFMKIMKNKKNKKNKKVCFFCVFIYTHTKSVNFALTK